MHFRSAYSGSFVGLQCNESHPPPITRFVSLSARTGIILAVLLLIVGRAAERLVWGRRARLDATVATIMSNKEVNQQYRVTKQSRRAFARKSQAYL